MYRRARQLTTTYAATPRVSGALLLAGMICRHGVTDGVLNVAKTAPAPWTSTPAVMVAVALRPGPRPPTRALRLFVVASPSATSITSKAELVLLPNVRALAVIATMAITTTRLTRYGMNYAHMIDLCEMNTTTVLIAILLIIGHVCVMPYVKAMKVCVMITAMRSRDIRKIINTVLVSNALELTELAPTTLFMITHLYLVTKVASNVSNFTEHYSAGLGFLIITILRCLMGLNIEPVNMCIKWRAATPLCMKATPPIRHDVDCTQVITSERLLAFMKVFAFLSNLHPAAVKTMRATKRTMRRRGLAKARQAVLNLRRLLMVRYVESSIVASFLPISLKHVLAAAAAGATSRTRLTRRASLIGLHLLRVRVEACPFKQIRRPHAKSSYVAFEGSLVTLRTLRRIASVPNCVVMSRPVSSWTHSS